MYKSNGQLVFSPSDLIRFMVSPFASWMELLRLDCPERAVPDPEDETRMLMAEAGNRHERKYLEKLQKERGSVCTIARDDDAERLTAEAICRGEPVIYQAFVRSGSFHGYADFLVRDMNAEGIVYEVWDTKLARRAKPYYLIQLCCYAEMVGRLTGTRPSRLRVVLGNGDTPEFRTSDFFYYYLSLKAAFLKQVSSFDPDAALPTPDPRADHGRWSSHAERILLESDHLVQVAGITVGQIKKLETMGIRTVASLAKAAKRRIPKLSSEVVGKLAEQADLQVRTRELRRKASPGEFVRPRYRIVPASGSQPRRGLALLPPASRGDVFFDMEGFPLADGGLEYLWGASHIERGQRRFSDWWAHDRQEEKRALEGFVDWVHTRWKKDPLMHVYHYASYEVTAVRRLMGVHGTREDEVDDLLRNGVFVDLYQIVRQGVRVGEGSYSIKKIEHLYRAQRAGEVATSGDSIVQYARWIESGQGGEWQASPLLKTIRDYNQEDCESTLELAEWLRREQSSSGITYVPPPGPPEEMEAKPEVEEWRRERALLEKNLDRLIGSAGTKQESGVSQMLRDLLEYHRREEKPMWWEYFARLGMNHEELYDDAGCIGGAKLQAGPPEVVKRSLVYCYSFDPNQETKIAAGAIVRLVDNPSVGFEVFEFAEDGKIRIKASEAKINEVFAGKLPAVTSFIPFGRVNNRKLRDAIASVARDWVDTRTLPPALGRFFARQAPDVRGQGRVQNLLKSKEEIVTGAVRIAGKMRDSLVCLQGPPGTGKTFTAAKMICALLDEGKRVGITSNSHKAILNLLRMTHQMCEGRLVGLKIGGDEMDPFFDECPGVRPCSSTEAAGSYSEGVVAGTAWLFAREEWAGMLDTLFVDEAGQVATANLVAMSRAAKNIVVLGDQMQLEQPIQGTHPRQSGRSVLDYYLEGHATIPPGLGLFLEKTRRLHPDICKVISELIYEDRLHSEAGVTERRALPPKGGKRLISRDSGVVYVPVEHDGNSQCSDEEADRIHDLANSLIGGRIMGPSGKMEKKIGWSDLLFVAPYNMQVRKLKARLPKEARVGSVDKFQGQEAAVVFVSMCCSPGEFGSRGLSFILDLNRLNVAISRAQALAVIVGDPRIALSPARNTEEMRCLNLYCRLVGEGGAVVAPV